MSEQKTSNQPNKEEGVPNEKVSSEKVSSKRRVLRGLIAAPVVMTLASRPALANRNFCTISGWGSMHASARPDDYTCNGRSPGFWGTYWSGPSSSAWGLTGFDQGPTNPLTSSNKLDDYSIPTTAELEDAVTQQILTQDAVDTYVAALQVTTTFDQLMGSTTFLPDNVLKPILRPTIMQILWEQNGDFKTDNNRAFHYAASLLNAAAWGADYGYTLEEMRNLIYLRGIEGQTFIDDLKGLYDRAYKAPK